MPVKPDERQYRMMAMPLTAFADTETVTDEDGSERIVPSNRFNSEYYVEGYATTFDLPAETFRVKFGRLPRVYAYELRV